MDEKKISAWDKLLQQLGAKPAPDALERKRPAIETQFEAPSPAAPAPKTKHGDWNALADQLGVEVPAELEPPQKRSTAPAEPRIAASSGAMEASFAGIEPMESAFEEIIEEEISDIEFEVDEDFGGDDQDDEGEVAEDSGGLSGEAARNAFEALFQAGSFSALPPVEKTPRKPGRRPGPQWRDDGDRPREERVENRVAEYEGEGQRERSEDEGSAEERDRPRRRRRRGGRGRGRQEDEPRQAREPGEEVEQWSAPSNELEAGEAAEPAEREFGEAEGEENRPRRKRRRGRGGRGSAGDRPPQAASDGGERNDSFDSEDDSDESAEDQGFDHEDDQESDEGAPRGSHKSIPSWSEAIGVMVETNMQSRKTSPQRPGPPRDRARGGRGRGRGGRGRRS